jgi:hypothetical protein
MLCLASCNKVDQGNPNPSVSTPTPQTEERKPPSERVVTEPTDERTKVTLLRVPNDGIQPQAVADVQGNLHLLYFKGKKTNAGDLFYVRRDAGKDDFSKPIRINSKPNTACAMGSVRGGQIALGKGGRVHVVWNGVGTDYARLNEAGTAFEEQRNLMRETEIPDGGGTLAADDKGNVYVVWHGQKKGDTGEANRKVWVARSTDDGKTFSMEEPAWAEATGVCPCCSTRAFADRDGIVYVLYRSATAEVNRDTYLLASEDQGKTFQEALIHKWKVPG